MNPLTHAYFVLELFKDQKLTPDQRDHLIVGSILPDISQFGLINFYRTHNQGLKFLHQVKDSLSYYFALGIISHGQKPPGLDYYSHKKNGYISLKQKPITKILKKYKKHLGKIDNGLAHNITEFSIDCLVTQKDPSLIKKVRLAFSNPKILDTTSKFFQFLNLSKRKSRKINRYLNNKHLHKFFRNFESSSGMAHNWLNLRFYRNLKHGRHLPFTEKIKKWTKISYYNFKRRIRNKNITNLFQETSSYLEKDYLQFLSQTQKDLTKLKNELLRDLGS